MLKKHNGKALIVILMALVMSMLTVSLYANDGVPTLDDIIGSEKQAQEATPEREPSKDNSSNDVAEDFSGLYEAAKMDMDNPQAAKMMEPWREAAGMVMTVIVYAMPALLAIKIAIEMIYILFPIVRRRLDGGRGEQFASQMAAGGMGGTSGLGGLGGFGMGSMGMNSLSTLGMGGMGMAMPGMQQGYRVSCVSNLAIRAAAADGTTKPDGTVESGIKMYFKHSIVTLILVPLTLIIAMSGSAYNIGIKLAELAVNAVSGIIG